MSPSNPPLELILLTQLATDRVGYEKGGFGYSLDAIEALKIADKAEVSEWRSFAEGCEIPGVDSVSRSKAAIIENIERLLEKIGLTAATDDDAQTRFWNIARLGTQLELVDHGQVHRWHEKFFVRTDAPSPKKGRFVGTFGMRGIELGELVRVIARPAERERGFRVNGIELFDAGLVIRWQHIQPESDYDGAMEWPRDEVVHTRSPTPSEVEISDDGGTLYTGGRGGSNSHRIDSGAVLSHGMDVYSPAVPHEARRLNIKADDVEFEVAVGGNDDA